MKRKKLQIAIDGPVGSGKSTVASALAKKLGLWYVDTGAMYRAAAYLVIKKGIDLNNEEEILRWLKKANLELSPGRENGCRVFLEGREVTGKIRSEAVGGVVAQVAQIPRVRKLLVSLQQKIAKDKGVAMEGRDIGIRVLPEASVKIFLTGSLTERARRKQKEILKRDGKIDFNKLYLAIKERDEKDEKREIDPLRKAEDAVEVDTTKLDIDGVVEKIMELVKKLEKKWE
jgi:cytidylate kinase